MGYPSLSCYSRELEKCAKCGDCAYAVKLTTARKPISLPCAVRNVLGFEAYDARGRIIVMKKLLEGKTKVDEKLLDWLYTCTTCANCKETCLAVPGGINTPSMVEALRKDLVDQGLSIPKHLSLRELVIDQHNPYGEPHSKRRSYLDGEDLPKEAKTIYFVGCTPSYRQQSIAQSTVKLLKDAGEDFTILEDEWCCGSVLLRLGYEESAREVMRHNLSEIEKTRAETVVTSCAGCYRALKEEYKKPNNNALGIQVLHVTELLDQLAEKGKISFSSKKQSRVTYHDPCHLGRHAGVYESPRRLIERVEGVELVEMKTNRSYAHCCGAGGGVKSTNPDLATQVARQRIIEALEVKPSLLLTACPFCKTNLANGSNEVLRIADITEYLAENISAHLAQGATTQEPARLKAPVNREFPEYLDNHPEIFEDLVLDSILDFATFNSWDAFDKGEKPLDVFNVKRTKDGIEINPGRAERADVALNLSPDAISDLIASGDRDEYAKKFGHFYNEPSASKWIDFILNKSTKTLIRMGYGKFAREAGILEEED